MIQANDMLKAPRTSAPSGWKVPLIILSDLHLGMWEDRSAEYSPAERLAALRTAVSLANERGAALLLNGDILDDRGGRRALKRECRMARECLEAHEHLRIFVRGNHDREFSRRKIRKRLGDCIVTDGHLHQHASGVVATHGDILHTGRGRKLIQHLGHLSRPQWKAMNRWMKADVLLQQELARMDNRDQALELFARVSAIRIAYERLECFTANSRSWLARRLRQAASDRASHLHRWADEVDLKEIGRAAQLAAVLGQWAAVCGHTHVPGLYRRAVLDPLSGEPGEVLVGNSGSFIQHGQPINCILAQYPALDLLSYNRDTQQWTLQERVALDVTAAPAETQPEPLAAAV